MPNFDFNRVSSAFYRFAKRYDVFIRTYTKVKGHAVMDDVITKVQLVASIQEIDGEKLTMFPEGTRIEEAKIAYTDHDLGIDDYEYNTNKYFITLTVPKRDGSTRQYRIVGKKEWQDDAFYYLLVQLRTNNAIPDVAVSKDK